MISGVQVVSVQSCRSELRPKRIKVKHAPDLFPYSSQEYSSFSDWCGSAGWASSCELRGRQFNTQSEPMPRLQARPLARSIREATNPLEVPLKHPCLSPSLSLSLPLSLKINKIFKKICFIFKEIVIRYCVVLYMSTQHQNQHHIQFRILPFLAEKRETSLSTSIKTSLITYRKE